MIDFVDIVPLFKLANDRNVDYLSHIYSDKSLLRKAVHQLVTEHLSKSEISRKSVLLKPNWVRHELQESDYLCLRTNDAFLLCVLEEILCFSPSEVLVADAPVQGCIWDRMITPAFLGKIDELSKRYNVPVKIKDFRRTVTDVGQNKVIQNIRPMSEYVLFDLGSKSYLEAITTQKNKFRITNYNPDGMMEAHHLGTHKYCIAKDVFDYDVIITVPKLKTHRMAGMTNALKLLVGINGDKDYLPHHRIGSVKEGGDNYKDKSFLRTLSNAFYDEGNRKRGTRFGYHLGRIGSKLWSLSKPDKATLINAGWYGNDTIWRTVLDINTIALYGDSEGNINSQQQRKLYIIMDGVIGGQGDGPLHPIPSPLGVIAMSNNPYLMDVVAGQLYHLNEEKIPLLKAAQKYLNGIDYSIMVNSKEVTIDEVKGLGIDINMSPGWEDYNL